MAGLQRSAVSFRRQGSSGLVWDEKFLSGELKQVNQDGENLEKKQETDVRIASSTSLTTIERSPSNGAQRGCRRGKLSPAIEPPSPKVSACWFCSAFGKTPKNRKKRGLQGRSR